MAVGKASPVSRPATIADYAADINTDPRMRAAWLEVSAARMAAGLLRAARLRHELSQIAMAEALGVSQARISQVESGRVEDIPSLELISRFLDACGERLVLSSESSMHQAVAVAPVTIETPSQKTDDAEIEQARQAPAGMD
jgi:transcriptional regulator with XRE-family HTH domain